MLDVDGREEGEGVAEEDLDAVGEAARVCGGGAGGEFHNHNEEDVSEKIWCGMLDFRHLSEDENCVI